MQLDFTFIYFSIFLVEESSLQTNYDKTHFCEMLRKIKTTIAFKEEAKGRTKVRTYQQRENQSLGRALAVHAHGHWDIDRNWDRHCGVWNLI